ncbi:A-kinase anchor protein inhibitor 1 [Panthera leo]|uniref:A-kinase anchor protein inhibitor 1 n=1 Tax=Panthera leo TaxID=9689 RepID=UPI001C6A87F7|nr:A-kinase anchor protein inhibitor 1 [Panthera leo]
MACGCPVCTYISYLASHVAKCGRVTQFPPMTCEKPGNEPEEVKLQKASKQIVQNVILQAVQQVSQESRQREDRTGDNQGNFQLGVGELTKKHEKK